MDKIAEQEAIVSEFIDDARSVMDDPEAGEASLVKAADLGVALLHSVSKEAEEAINRTTDHVHHRKAAQKDPHCSAGKVRRLEKAEKILVAQHEALSNLYAHLSDFMSELQVRLHEYESEEAHEEQPETSERLETLPLDKQFKKLPWWKRLLGVHQEAPSEASRSARESLTSSSQADSDHEDYEKLLTWYEQNLEVLEKAVAGRQAGEPGDWSQVVDELLGRMAWCDRNMDAIELRNPRDIPRELLSRRDNLASRRTEVDSQ